MREVLDIREGLFIDDGNDLRLAASQCDDCKMLFFPKESLCLNCMSERLTTIPLSNKGTLYTFTRCDMAAAKFDPPFYLGYVELSEGIRVLSPLIGSDDTLTIGMEMSMSVVPLWEEDDVATWGYTFIPVKNKV